MCKVEFIICGDFNIDYLTDNYRKSQLNSLLNSFNLFSIIDFPTRIQNTSKSAIDNIFIDYLRLETFKVFPIPNGLSDHDAQLVMMRDIMLPIPLKACWTTRKIDKCSLTDFNYRLSFEMWKEVFDENDINIMFNSFLNIFLRLFNTSFPKSTAKPHITKKKLWISSNIKTKCNIKRHLYMISRNSNDPNIKRYYKTYFKSLARNIIIAKRLYYDKQILNSNDRIKSSWNIIKSLTGRKSQYNRTTATFNYKNDLMFNLSIYFNQF
jgi:hypothetical protein